MTSVDFFWIFWPQTIFIWGCGMKFNFLDFFYFWTSNDQKGEICIQTVKFIIKRSNLNLSRPIRRRQLATAQWPQQWAVVPESAPTRTLPAGPGNLKPCCSLSPPHHRKQAVLPNVQALPPPVRTVVGTSLVGVKVSPTFLSSLRFRSN
jgi:hypothetical protein